MNRVSSGWNHLPAERPHRRAGRRQPGGVSVEREEDDHREHPAAAHAAVQVKIVCQGKAQDYYKRVNVFNILWFYNCFT